MNRKNKWFEDFLESFPKGVEKRISEEQFEVFERYATESYERGYVEHFAGEGYDAYSWACASGAQYFVTVFDMR